jgi:tRNA nucleotidyltransferase/poly(A) polymerase
VSAALNLYEKSGALGVLYPELDTLVGLEKDTGLPVWTQTLAAVDALSPTRPVLRMAALLHAIGMPAARTRDLRGDWRFTGHEVRGARAAETIMRRLKASNYDIERVTTLVRIQSELFPPDAPDAGVRRWLRHISPEYVGDFFRLRFAFCRAERQSGADLLERWRKVHKVLLQHPVLDLSGLAIGGSELKALGLKPGPQYGEILEALVQRVIEDPTLNEPDKLTTIVTSELLP